MLYTRTASLYLADHEEPQCGKKNQGSQIEEPVRPIRFRPFLEPDGHSVLLESIDHRPLVGRRNHPKATAFDVRPVNYATRNRDLADLAALDLCQEIGIADFGDCLR